MTAAFDLLTNGGENLLQDLTVQTVEAAESLGSEIVGYVLAASCALAVNDEVAAAKFFRSRAVFSLPPLSFAG